MIGPEVGGGGGAGRAGKYVPIDPMMLSLPYGCLPCDGATHGWGVIILWYSSRNFIRFVPGR